MSVVKNIFFIKDDTFLHENFYSYIKNFFLENKFNCDFFKNKSMFKEIFLDEFILSNKHFLEMEDTNFLHIKNKIYSSNVDNESQFQKIFIDYKEFKKAKNLYDILDFFEEIEKLNFEKKESVYILNKNCFFDSEIFILEKIFKKVIFENERKINFSNFLIENSFSSSNFLYKNFKELENKKVGVVFENIEKMKKHYSFFENEANFTSFNFFNKPIIKLTLNYVFILLNFNCEKISWFDIFLKNKIDILTIKKILQKARFEERSILFIVENYLNALTFNLEEREILKNLLLKISDFKRETLVEKSIFKICRKILFDLEIYKEEIENKNFDNIFLLNSFLKFVKSFEEIYKENSVKFFLDKALNFLQSKTFYKDSRKKIDFVFSNFLNEKYEKIFVFLDEKISFTKLNFYSNFCDELIFISNDKNYFFDEKFEIYENENFLKNYKNEKKKELGVEAFHKFSVSQIGLYESCPLKYKFSYVYKIPQEEKYFFSFGITIHKVLEEIIFDIKEKLPFERIFGKAISLLHKYWLMGGYYSSEQQKEYFEKAVKLLKNFILKSQKMFEENLDILSVEKRFEIELSGKKIIGVIDRIDNLENEFKIIDYKTSKKEITDEEITYNKQLFVYSKAIEKLYGKKPSSIGLWYLLFSNLKEISLDKLNSEIIEKDILYQISQIEKGNFEANPSSFNCKFCDFKKICKFAFRNEYD